jgi:hypothetical protein
LTHRALINICIRCTFYVFIGKHWQTDIQNTICIIDDGKELSSANSSRDARHNGYSVEKNRNYRHALHCVNIFASHSLLFYPVFFFIAKWFRERNSFFTVRRFNSTNSIFHRPCCREFNWAQGVSIFVECNMQSSDLSNQILVCCRLHSDAATNSW